ncbi:glutamate ABC transporter substrate-binding protein [Streptomyces sp. XM4193]|uniref:glutamate ABC transporter substrate-binding protein n=1 Tax=Streptomyces sp. XM4193 TaxID=2929782 RepID=UPI001FF86541|nr:glutamate ABC transporter substrate-binding protein [Streptomyces sp. XM4193]MCK1797452.1 glutamate ABC transporter substrate-binding protein [Streptomyces sp. XM4193]
MAVRTRIAVVGALLALLAAGCGDDSESKDKSIQVDTDASFPAGSTMADLKDKGTVRIGVKYDQPNVGFRESEDKAPEGFDVEIAKILAGRLGIAPSEITWVEAQSKDRESMLKEGRVDLIVASYSITEDRLKQVGMAGPYYATGQQLLVRKGEGDIDGPEDIEGKSICAASGSTSLAMLEKKYGAESSPASTYGQCVNQLLEKEVDAVTTDGAILLGYAADRPEELEVVGEPFSEENYGVGYKRGDSAMCEFLTHAIKRTHRDGSWAQALSRTLWKSTGGTPEPEVEPCPEAAGR